MFLIFKGQKTILEVTQTKYNDFLQEKIVAELFSGSVKDFLTSKLVEILVNHKEKENEIFNYMKKYSVEGVKNPWSKSMDSFKSKRWRYSEAQKKASEKEAAKKVASEKDVIE